MERRHPELTPQEVERIARATNAALRALLTRLRSKITELETRQEPWAAKWTALKLSARRALEEQEATGTPTAVIVTETARAMLAEMRRLEQEDAASTQTVETASQTRWEAMKRWLSNRAVLHDRMD
jgi:phage shock protein A